MGAHGSAALRALVADPAQAGLVMDFDGVLSPIVDDPASSRLADGVAESLEHIAARLKLVALISGRPLAFLRDRATVPGVSLLGSYGVEELRDGVEHVHGGVGDWIDVVAEAQAELRARFAGVEGVRVEDKRISVAVHWRQAPDQARAAGEVLRATSGIAERTGLHREPGKLVEELRPALDRDKGAALGELVVEHGLAAVAYAGDDLGDLPAFRAVAAAGGHALVVDHGAETDPRLRAVAGERFDGVEGFSTWLAELAGAL